MKDESKKRSALAAFGVFLLAWFGLAFAWAFVTFFCLGWTNSAGGPSTGGLITLGIAAYVAYRWFKADE